MFLLQQQGGYGDSKYGFSANTNGATNNGHGAPGAHNIGPQSNEAPPYHSNPMTHSPPQSPLYGTGKTVFTLLVIRSCVMCYYYNLFNTIFRAFWCVFTSEVRRGRGFLLKVMSRSLVWF